MKKKEYTSLRFNQVTWNVISLAENVFLLQAPKNIDIDLIHSSTKVLENNLSQELQDIVPAYDSIAVFTNLSMDELVGKLVHTQQGNFKATTHSRTIEIPICYELGLDLEHIGKHTGLSADAIVGIHLAGTYRSLFIGFTPGFIYADGLDASLACPRKDNPRTHIEAGSIGIGGEQTGIYSLDSPGGWNIIGRTPMTLFDPGQQPPMAVEVGTSFSFRRITRKEFDSWGN